MLRPTNRWKTLFFYQKANTLFQLTVVFCERFLPKYGDRTVDQMIQAARSGKQNIIEGSEDGKTSTEMELGGIKERMYAARIGYRKAQDEEYQRLVAENATLRAQLATAQEEIAHLRKLINKND